jgi:SAM-dependent methyltransferase
MTNETTLRMPQELLRRGGFKDDEVAVGYGVLGLELMCRKVGLEDLGDTELLDFGCGFSFTQALINRSLPIRRYVGVDVSKDIIEFLRANVDDPRFKYHRIDAQNEMYNPDGEPMTESMALPIGEDRFDLISLFSVFTHMAPADSENLLRILHDHVKPDGRLFFSIYIDELTEGGHGLMDKVAAAAGEEHVGKIDTFQDLNAKKPLDWAVYSERYARELLEATGWTALSLSPPAADPSIGRVFIQHHFVCAPKPL